jgi:hypothetical protein
MRFVSPLIPCWWVVLTVDAYVPFLTRYVNSILLVLYGIVAAALYVEQSYPRWRAKLLAMGTDQSVGNTFVLGEFVTTLLASVVSVYWFVPNIFHIHLFVLLSVVSAACHVALEYYWKHELTQLLHQFDNHLDDAL